MPSLRHIPSEPELGQRTDAYLDAARACLLDLGWRRTTLTEVSRRAGVSRMTIYRTWADMPTLLGDLMTREWSQVLALVLAQRSQPGEERGGEAGEDAGEDPLSRLVDDLLLTVRALRENELFSRIVELDAELLLPYLLARRGRSQELMAGLVAEAVRHGQDVGAVRAGDPTTIARALLLTLHGHVLSRHTMVDPADGRPEAQPEAATDRPVVDEAALEAELAAQLRGALAPTPAPTPATGA
ncbi:TetR/AcrR family transcriptional regulator [Nocardioides sp. GY 10127]|uniref:TetR/AcrR family transcriptional regulator n=1 Tax=Nocardioides sp. GY 10127 TaxID=2569762 RepID=UPI0010A81418|nr:TetR/AcrR family transcriptional regulator [Nocardioides sp. GY 10127]TIC82854.1 TetR/AcrR family transcriptional regulator [Nocardioides sp. GY 10127]